jgi:hypothetical protein
MRLIALCLLSVLLSVPAVAQSHDRSFEALGGAYLQDPVTGNLLTVEALDTSIRQSNSGSWAGHVNTGSAYVQIGRPGQDPAELIGYGQVQVNGEFDLGDESHPEFGGRWNLERLNITLQAVLVDEDGQTWVYTAHIQARDGNFTRFVSSLDPA